MRRGLWLLCLALVAGLLPAALPAAADECLPSGGSDLAEPEPVDAEFPLAGGGWGHGAGMSQYGAHGAALLGCDAETIVKTYYPGVEVAAPDALPEQIRVSLWPDRPDGSPVAAICVGAHTGAPDWDTGEETFTQPVGTFWRVDHLAQGAVRLSQFATPSACRAPETAEPEQIWEGGETGQVLRIPIDGDTIVQLTSKSTNTQWADGRPYKHGTMEFRSANTGLHLLMEIGSTDDHQALDRYLRGLSEMPSSWHSEALKAQAIAGRSYALDRWERFAGGRSGCFCDLYDSVWDQVYSGYLKESEGDGAKFGQRWVAAVDATATKVLRHEGATAAGYYSSSHGGHSESGGFVFGNDVAHLAPVDDSRWEAALRDSDSLAKNPNLTWSVGFSGSQLASRLDEAELGVGDVEAIELPEPHGAKGRVGRPPDYGGVRIVGSERTRTLTGDRFRQVMGLRSTLFRLGKAAPAPAPISCDPTGEISDDGTVDRVSGAERIATAVEVSTRHWSEVRDVLLATADDYPDALASGSLAATLGAPLLLTRPDELPPEVLAEIERLDVSTVWILGGTRAVSSDVEQELLDAGVDVSRVAGGNRFETARQIAFSPSAATRPTVALVMDQDWPAAVAAGALAASSQRVPTLLTHRDTVPGVTERALEELETETVLLVGGQSTITEEVAGHLSELGYDVERLAGGDRFETSMLVAAEGLERSAEGVSHVVLATGKDFPDALAAGSLAAHLAGTLILTPQCSLDEAEVVREFLTEQGEQLDQAVIVGGTAAVSDRVREQVTELLQAS